MNQGTFSDYHYQDGVYSGYMFIFCGCSPLWLLPESGCGLFAGGSNVFHGISGGGLNDYTYWVGSRLSKN